MQTSNQDNIKNLPVVVSAMGVVILQTAPESSNQVLVVEAANEFMLPKGRVEDGDSDIVDTAIREIYEETAVKLSRHHHRGQIDTFGFEFKKQNVYKKIEVQLFVIDTAQDITMEEGFASGQWMDVQRALVDLSHEDAKNMVKKALGMLVNKV